MESTPGLTGAGPDADQTGRESVETESGQSQNMGELLDAQKQSGYRTPRRGDVVDGVVVRMDRDGILVDIGSKSEGLVPAHDLQAMDTEASEIKVGDEVVVYVVQSEDQEGRALLSMERARAEKGWRALQQSFENQEMLEAKVVDYNKGGVIVLVSGVRGFVPSSQVVGLRPQSGEGQEENRLSSMLGQVLRLKIIEMNRRRNRLILSERVAMQEWRAQQRDKLLQELEVGQIRHGRVSSITTFGAFVDLGGADGLVHLSEISWERIRNPQDVLKVGDEVDVSVVSVDPETKKIALSLRRAQPEPWSRAGEKFYVGQLVRATITKLTTFGAFARVEAGIEGLIHISEMSDRRVGHPKEVVKEGEVVVAKVVRFEPERRRLGLSMREAEGEILEDAAVPEGETSP